jgi:hypothetical protein
MGARDGLRLPGSRVVGIDITRTLDRIPFFDLPMLVLVVSSGIVVARPGQTWIKRPDARTSNGFALVPTIRRWSARPAATG